MTNDPYETDQPAELPVEIVDDADTSNAMPVPSTSEAHNPANKPEPATEDEFEPIETRPIDDDVPDHLLTRICVLFDRTKHWFTVTDGTRVKAIKSELGAGGMQAVYKDDTGRTRYLNDDDCIADYLDDGDTLAFQDDAKFATDTEGLTR